MAILVTHPSTDLYINEVTYWCKNTQARAWWIYPVYLPTQRGRYRVNNGWRWAAIHQPTANQPPADHESSLQQSSTNHLSTIGHPITNQPTNQALTHINPSSPRVILTWREPLRTEPIPQPPFCRDAQRVLVLRHLLLGKPTPVVSQEKGCGMNDLRSCLHDGL